MWSAGNSQFPGTEYSAPSLPLLCFSGSIPRSPGQHRHGWGILLGPGLPCSRATAPRLPHLSPQQSEPPQPDPIWVKERKTRLRLSQGRGTTLSGTIVTSRTSITVNYSVLQISWAFWRESEKKKVFQRCSLQELNHSHWPACCEDFLPKAAFSEELFPGQQCSPWKNLLTP